MTRLNQYDQYRIQRPLLLGTIFISKDEYLDQLIQF